MEDGRIIPMEKVRSKSRAMEKIIEFVTEFSDLEYIALLQDGFEPDGVTRSIADRLKGIYPRTPITINSYNPAVATFVGLNSIGVVVLDAEEGLQ
jgi:fatty acid-binding protein DegV